MSQFRTSGVRMCKGEGADVKVKFGGRRWTVKGYLNDIYEFGNSIKLFARKKISFIWILSQSDIKETVTE